MANPIELGVKVTSDTADFEAKTAASERAWGRFTGALTTVESKTTGVLNALKQVGAAAPEALGTMGTAAEGATRSFVRTQETLTGLAASIPRLAGLILGPIGIAIAAAAAVATAAWHVFKDDTFAIFGEVEGEAVTLSEAVGASWEVAKGLARDAFTAIGSFAKEAFAGIKTWFAEMPDDAGQAFDYVQQTAMKSWQRVVDGARWMWELLTGLANAGVQGMVAALPALWDAFKNYFTQIGKVGAAAWDALKTGSLEPLTAQIRESTKSIGESGRSVGSAFAAGFRENLPPAFDDLKRWAGDAWDSIKTRFKGAVAEMRRAATTSDTDGKSGASRGQELLAAEQALQQALTALERAGIDARRALEQGALDETLRDLQANFQLRKIAEEDYINQSADLQRQKIGKAIAGLNEENDAVVAKINALVQQYTKLAAAGDTKKALDTQKKIADALRDQVGILARIDSAERALNEVERNRGRELEAYTQRQRDANAAAIEAIDRYREKLAEAGDQRRFEISLIGKTAEQQQVLRATHAAEVELQRIMNDLRRVEVQIARELVREEGTRQSVIEDLTRQQNVLFQQAADQRVEITRAETDARDKINAESAERLRSGLVDALYNGLMSGRGFANSLRDYFKQVLGTGLRSILQQAVSGLFGGGAGGGGGGILSLLGSLFGGSGGGSGGGNGGGNGGLMSSLFSGIGGLWNSAWGMNLGAGFSGLFGGASQLVSGTIGGMTELGLGFGEALSGAVEALGGFGATLGAVIPVIGIVVAALSALGVFADETGIKIDNSVRGVGNPASHFQQSGLGAFDYSGDIPNSAFDALTRRIQGLDDAVIKAFLDDDTLATVRANIQALTNGDWYGFDDQASAKEAVEKATIRFLKERYGTAFDAVDTQLAGAIRAFAGTSDELMTFIQAATEAKAALDELHRIAPDVKLSVSALLAASDEQRNALTALAATLQMTSSDYWQAAKDAWAASQMTLTQALSAQGATVLKLATSFDGSLAAAQALAQAEQQRLQMVAALIQQIGQAALEIKGMFGQSAEQFRLAGMTPDQQYYYYDKQAKDTFDALSQATDVSEITRLAQQYNQYLTTAFGLLSPEQRLAKGNDYAALADKANEVSQERLREAEARAREEQDALDGKIEVAVKTAMQVVADKMTAAADKIATAAATPTTVVVTGRVTVEIDGGAGTQTVDVGLAGIRTAGGA